VTAVLLARCSEPGCTEAVAQDGATTPDVEGLCYLHRQRSRNARGLCPNCSTAMEREPVLNELTGQQRKDQDRQPVWRESCAGCHYTRRAR
jgi:hypothetical protein